MLSHKKAVRVWDRFYCFNVENESLLRSSGRCWVTVRWWLASLVCTWWQESAKDCRVSVCHRWVATHLLLHLPPNWTTKKACRSPQGYGVCLNTSIPIWWGAQITSKLPEGVIEVSHIVEVEINNLVGLYCGIDWGDHALMCGWNKEKRLRWCIRAWERWLISVLAGEYRKTFQPP